MADVDRRTFLARSGLLAAAAGAAAVVPGVLTTLSADAPEVDAAATDASSASADDLVATAASSSEPLIAHVRDLETGEIGIFNGAKEIVVQNPALARSILRAAR